MVWFEEAPTYSGVGRAEFTDPVGFVEGPATASFDGRGGSAITLEARSYKCEEPLPFGIMQLLSGERPSASGAGTSLPIGPFRNRCKDLTIQTECGIFSATEGIRFEGLLRPGVPGSASLRFHSVWSSYDEGGRPDDASFWVLPLFNYVAESVPRRSAVDRHPLRLRPPPEIPASLAGDVRIVAEINAFSENHIVVFEYGGVPAFLELFPDVDCRRASLRGAESPRLITALLIGALVGPIPKREGISEWHPLEIPSLLGLASGTRVAPAWVEFRTRNADLVHRIHANFGRPVFHLGQEIIDERATNKTGYLLSKALGSTHLGSSWLRVALRHVVELGRLDASLEERMWHLIEIFECYCQHEGIGQQPLLAGIDPGVEAKVRDALKRVAKEIEAVASQNPSASSQLSAVADRARGACQIDRRFGLAASELLRRHGFVDFDLVNSHYATNRRPDGQKTIEDVVTKYRGEVVHRAFFDFLAGAFEVNEVHVVERHLHDIALRLAFKYLGYDACYRAPLGPGPPDRPVDWVTASTSATELGY